MVSEFKPFRPKTLEGDALSHLNPIEKAPEKIAEVAELEELENDGKIIVLGPSDRSASRVKRWDYDDVVSHLSLMEEDPEIIDETNYVEEVENYEKDILEPSDRSAVRIRRWKDETELVTPHIDPEICSTGVQHFAHPNRCDMYIQCVHGKPMERPCGPGTYWDAVGAGNCGYWENSYCAIRMHLQSPTTNCRCNDFNLNGKYQQASAKPLLVYRTDNGISSGTGRVIVPSTSPPLKRPLSQEMTPPPKIVPQFVPKVSKSPAEHVEPCEKHEFPEYDTEPEREIGN